jgi:hypothetical protein
MLLRERLRSGTLWRMGDGGWPFENDEGLVGVGSTSPIQVEPVPLPVFAATTAFEVMSFVPWPGDDDPVVYPAPRELGFGPAYIVTAVADDRTAVSAITQGAYPTQRITAGDVRIRAVEALHRHGGVVGEGGLEFAVGDWTFIIALAPELRAEARNLLTSLAEVQA